MNKYLRKMLILTAILLVVMVVFTFIMGYFGL
jgi:hypothetical protein